MTAQEAIKLVDAALENHWLNLHEGPFPEDQKDADEFEAALGLVKVVAKWKSQQKHLRPVSTL